MATTKIPPINFHFPRAFALSGRRELKAFLIGIFRKEKTQLASLNYIFCSDEYLLGINQQYLRHNYFTDIITFNLAGKTEPVSGEIYISVDRVKDNSKTLGVPFKEEIHRVIFHAVLHLCGYKDKTASEKRVMRQKEDYYLRQFLG